MPASLDSGSAQASCLLFPFAFLIFFFFAFCPTFTSVVPLLSMLAAWPFTVLPPCP